MIRPFRPAFSINRSAAWQAGRQAGKQASKQADRPTDQRGSLGKTILERCSRYATVSLDFSPYARSVALPEPEGEELVFLLAPRRERKTTRRATAIAAAAATTTTTTSSALVSARSTNASVCPSFHPSYPRRGVPGLFVTKTVAGENSAERNQKSARVRSNQLDR